MKAFYLGNDIEFVYFVVWAVDEEDAREKALARAKEAKVPLNEINFCEEFTEGSYGGVLMFY